MDPDRDGPHRRGISAAGLATLVRPEGGLVNHIINLDTVAWCAAITSVVMAIRRDLAASLLASVGSHICSAASRRRRRQRDRDG